MNYYLHVLKNYALFEGRARRAEYWYFVLFNILIFIGVRIIAEIIRIPEIGLLYLLGVLLPGIAVGIRRMHDVGKSGWFILIPIYNLVLAATEGDKGPNEYGTDPKDPTGTADNGSLDSGI
jgi:uncharacterized membrane protein YhaH (DUF805 family)